MNCENLVIGGNSYIGQHLCVKLSSTHCIAATLNEPNTYLRRITSMRFIAENIERSTERFKQISPETVYLVARPETLDPSRHLAFDQNIEMQLGHWIREGRLKRIVFLSTQLVYRTPNDSVPIGLDHPKGPVTGYDWAKLAMEMRLGLLSKVAPKVNVEIYRLPLVAGGFLTEQQVGKQFLYFWMKAYATGGRFSFPENCPNWGNSWVSMFDLLEILTTPTKGGYSISQPVSGHFTYLNLDAIFAAKFPLVGKASRIPLNKTFFFLRNTTRIPERGIEELAALLTGEHVATTQG